jgi:hypothetical protein
MDRMFGEIDRIRRHFLSVAALTLANAQLGIVRSAAAQSKTPSAPPVKTGEFFPGVSTELVKTRARSGKR